MILRLRLAWHGQILHPRASHVVVQRPVKRYWQTHESRLAKGMELPALLDGHELVLAHTRAKTTRRHDCGEEEIL